MNVGDLISWSSAFSKSSLHIWKFLVYVLLMPSLEDLGHYLASMWNECNCAVVWTFFRIVLLWDWNENWPFPILWPAEFSKFTGILSAALSQHHLSGLITLDPLYRWNPIAFVCDWLISLGKMSSRFIHVVVCVRILFFKTIIFHCMCVPHSIYPLICQ